MGAQSQTLADEIPHITETEFERFRDFFYRKTGIRFEDSKRYFVDKRLIDRMEKTGCKDFRTYFTFMRFEASGNEVQQLINSMTVNETYFYREEYQFEGLVDEIMDEVVKAKPEGSPIRIWSIPSSTGEEPYSIALYLLEKWPGIENYDVEIVSSDIDSNVLKQCKAGVYGPRSVQHLPKNVLGKYFSPQEDGNFQICDDLREAIEFTQVNLSEPAHTRKYRNFDVVFCRNLLIYFDEASRRQAAEVFFDALNPGGYIFLGHSESMSRISSLFKVRRLSQCMVYQKPMK